MSNSHGGAGTRGYNTSGELTDAGAALLRAALAPHLPSGSAARKGIPIVTGVLDYFPDAIAAIARLSKAGNDKHNPGEPLHWSRDKSTDHADCIGRHLLERGTVEPESGELHDTCLAWRALANLQLAIEDQRNADEAGIRGG